MKIKTQKQLEAFAKSHYGKKFRLTSRTTIFRAVHFQLVAGFIPALTGHTLDGRFQTQPRIEDIIWLE